MCSQPREGVAYFPERPLVRSSAGDHGGDRPGDDRYIEPDRPVLQVREVEPDEVVERQAGPAGDLPEARHAREHRIASAMPSLEEPVVAKRQRARTDEAHLALEHVDDLWDLIEREPTKKAADPRNARVVANLEERSFGFVRCLEL